MRRQTIRSAAIAAFRAFIRLYENDLADILDRTSRSFVIFKWTGRYVLSTVVLKN